ncbi:MAG: hypothetical protein OK474_03040 [Thaumarchaeota archaeon]|nr:hypothetical protein [Nitrososphaerota archaeon]
MSEHPQRGHTAIAAAIVVAGVLISASMFVAVSGATRTTTRTVTTTTTTMDQEDPPPSTSSSAHGLALLLSINASQLTPGQALDVSLSLTNILSTTNNLTADGGAWASLPEVSLGPCGNLNHGFGYLVAQGFYTASNASSATPLALYAPGIYNCPAVFKFSYYLFQPYSYLAALCGSGEGSCIQFPASYSGAVRGSWGADGSSPGTFASFRPGVYTVLAVAEWGQVDALHFTVT